LLERLFVARHTETTYNARRLVNGDPAVDVALTERGREQARRLGAALAHTPIELCVTTEFPRTHETARIALAGRDVPMTVLPALNDAPAGRFEGGPIEEMGMWFRNAGWDAVVPGSAESFRDAGTRFVAAATWLAGRPERTIIVVAHAFSITWLAQTSRRQAEPRVTVTQGEAIAVTGDELRAALPVVAKDPFADFHWEGRPVPPPRRHSSSQ
jgi:broad specificity phosphatase PhoE